MSFKKPTRKDQLLFLTVYTEKSENNWVLFCQNHPIFFDNKSLFVIQKYEENSKFPELFEEEEGDVQLGNIIFKNRSSRNWKFAIFGISEFYSKRNFFEKVRQFFGSLFRNEENSVLERTSSSITNLSNGNSEDHSMYRNRGNTVIFNNDKFNETTVFEIQQNGQGSIFSIFYESEVSSLKYKTESSFFPRVCVTDENVFIYYEYNKNED